MKEEKVDAIFKRGLEEPADDAAFMEHDWDALEKKLDQGKKGGARVMWLSILGSVAAAALLFLGWWLFKPQSASQTNNTQLAVKTAPKTQQQAATGQPAKVPQVVKTDSTPQVATTTPQPNSVAQKARPSIINPIKTGNKDDEETLQNKVEPAFIAVNKGIRKNNGDGPPSKITAADNTQPANTNAPSDGATIGDAKEVLAAAGNKKVGITPYQLDGSALAMTNMPSTSVRPIQVDGFEMPKTVNGKAVSSFRPQFALSVLVASERNGVNSLQKTSSGTNVGMLFSVGVKKLTLSTGATYSVKPYTLPFSEYHTSYDFKNQPEYVTADCRVLDIPINLDYQLYSKRSDKFSLGAGLSSYIMMHESYTYDYGSTSTVYGPSYYAVKGKGKYLFSIMNIQATYQRKINSRFNLSVQPYFKLPLSDIGYSQVKVQTFGVAAGLSWNINSLTKK